METFSLWLLLATVLTYQASAADYKQDDSIYVSSDDTEQGEKRVVRSVDKELNDPYQRIEIGNRGFVFYPLLPAPGKPPKRTRRSASTHDSFVAGNTRELLPPTA